MNGGFIKLHRCVKEWEYKRNPKIFCVWIHLLIIANYEPKTWKGVSIKRGQCVTSTKSLAEGCGLSEQNVRTALKHLEINGSITSKSTNKYTLITICNYDSYQGSTSENQRTNYAKTNVNLTATQEIKNERTKEDVTINSKYVPSKNDENIKKEFESLSYEVESALKNNSVDMSMLTLKQYQELRQTNSKAQILGIVYSIINYKRWHSYGSLYGAIKRFIESDIKIDIEDNERGNNGDYPF